MRDRLLNNLWLPLAGLVAVLLIPPVAIISVFWKDVQFAPDIFVNEYMAFLGTLVSILFGFLLVQIYWETRMDREHARRARRLFLSHVVEIGQISAEVLRTYEQHASNPDEHFQIENSVRTGINHLQDASWSITRFINDWQSTGDEVLTTQLTLFTRNVVPQIERLARMKTVGPGNPQVHSLIGQVLEKADGISKTLGGQNNVTDSTR